MFTGIVTDVGKVRHIEKRGDTHVVIATAYDVSAVDVGASISCSGVCMTVVDKGTAKDRWFAFTASGETLSKTTLGSWKVGEVVNLERPMRVGDEFGGHIVTGHVDAVAEIVSVKPEGESVRMIFEVPVKLAPSTSLMAFTTYSCHKKLCRRRVPKSVRRNPGTPRSRSMVGRWVRSTFRGVTAI